MLGTCLRLKPTALLVLILWSVKPLKNLVTGLLITWIILLIVSHYSVTDGWEWFRRSFFGKISNFFRLYFRSSAFCTLHSVIEITVGHRICSIVLHVGWQMKLNWLTKTKKNKKINDSSKNNLYLQIRFDQWTSIQKYRNYLNEHRDSHLISYF